MGIRVSVTAARKLLGRKAVPVMPAQPNECELLLASQLEAAGLPLGKCQWLVGPDRKFCWDRAWPEISFAVEIDGGVHRIQSKFAAGIAKHNYAMQMGWTWYRFSPSQVRSGAALEMLRGVLT